MDVLHYEFVGGKIKVRMYGILRQLCFMSEEVQSMCNLSMGVLNKGISVGEMKKAKETVYKLRDMGLPIDKIAYAVEVDIDTIHEWLAERDEMLVK